MPTISRRKFIQASSASYALLAVGCIPGTSKEEIANVSGIPSESLNQFITIDTKGTVTLFNHRPEMGQGTFQSIPMILAEELEVDINTVIIRQSEANRELYGRQMVVGSRSIQSEYMKMRKIGAASKEILIQAAANRWKVSTESCRAENGEVINADGDKLSYGELVKAATQIPAPKDPKLKDHKDFTIIGQPIPRQDIPLKTNGEARFGIDASAPGMLYASIERSPVFLGTVKDINKDDVLKVPGVKHVFKTQRKVYGTNREGVAVLADNYWSAVQGRKALKVEWDQKGLEKESSETILKRYKEATKGAGDDLFTIGNPTNVFKNAGEVIEAAYEMPYQAHVPMEPMNAMVHIRKNDAEFWGSTQNPNGIKDYISQTYNIPEDKVTINYTFMGGGFGRRSMTDVVEEAADLSTKSGTPVKVVWTREDDQTQGPFRACSYNVCRAVLKDGKVNALEHKVVAQEIRNQTGDKNTAGRQLMGGINTHYNIPNQTVRGLLQKHYIPISYWRAVYHSTNPFAHESFIDELAYKVGKDPLQFRLDMLQGHERFKRVLELVAKKTNWKDPKPAHTGRGVALAERSGAHFAMVVEIVRTSEGNVRVKKITTALDVGTCINPDTTRAQTEGSITMGLTAALHGLTIKNGQIAETNFDTYPLLRMDESPEIETHIISTDASPDGAGESGLPTVAPALANAIFDLTGKRIRKLPIDLRNLT